MRINGFAQTAVCIKPLMYMINQQIESSLVPVMAWHLLGAKPLPEPMLTYCQWDPQKQSSVKFK